MKFKLIAVLAATLFASNAAMSTSRPSELKAFTTTIGSADTPVPSLNYVGGFNDTFTLKIGTAALSLLSLTVTGDVGSFSNTASQSLYNSGLTLSVYDSATNAFLATGYSILGSGPSANSYVDLLPMIPNVARNTTYTVVVSGTSTTQLAKFTISGIDVTVGPGTLTAFTPVTPVPEPESYAMFLAGLGLMGAIAKRRKSKQA